MSRQDQFEKVYAQLHEMDSDLIRDHRFESKEGYSLPRLASAYRVYCATMDSIVVELPKAESDDGESWDPCWKYGVRQCREAIEAAGIKVAP